MAAKRAILWLSVGWIFSADSCLADHYLCPDSHEYFTTAAACEAACVAACTSLGEVGGDVGLEVVDTWGTAAGFTTVTKPLLSDAPMSTFDGSVVGAGQITCPGVKKFLEILVTPSPQNDIDFVQAVVDSDMDGVFDGGLPGGIFTARDPISGTCANGVVSCAPGTYTDCTYYQWQYDPGQRIILPVETIATSLKGCFCFNASCSPANFAESKDVILQTIGAGIINAITSADTSITASKSEIDGPVIRYYGDDLADCAVAPDGEVAGLDLNLSTFGAADPVAAVNAGVSLDQLAQHEVDKQTAEAGSLLSLLMSSVARTNASAQECAISRTPWVKRTTIDQYFCPTTKTTYASEKTCQDAGCYGDFVVDHMFLDSQPGLFKNVYLFFSGPAGLDALIISSKLLGEGGRCSVAPRPRLNTFLVQPQTTIEFQAGFCSTNIESMYTGMHPPTGTVAPYWQLLPFVDASSGESATVEIAQLEFSPDGERLLVTARVVDFQATYEYWCPEADETICTDTIVINDHDYITVEFVAQDRADYVCDYRQQEVQELIEETQDGCKILDVDPECAIRNETRYDAAGAPIKTIVNGAFTGASPTETCRVIEEFATVCYDWWRIERDYLCQDDVDLTPNIDRVAAIDNSLAATQSGYGYTDHSRDVTYDPDSGGFVFGGVNVTEGTFDFLHNPAEECQFTCKVLLTNKLSQANSAGTTANYRVDATTGVVSYRNCVNNVCPVKPGETILTPCSCINEFDQATSIMNILHMTGKDLICSDGVKKSYR